MIIESQDPRLNITRAMTQSSHLLKVWALPTNAIASLQQRITKSRKMNKIHQKVYANRPPESGPPVGQAIENTGDARQQSIGKTSSKVRQSKEERTQR